VVETKVAVATLATALTSIALALLRHQHVDDATIQTVVLAVITFAAAWLAPHTPRPAG
jgi:hypothetical protein